ncbi:hypothetical protein RIF29_25406 [Crotalaria pallida]|uniref:LOB domain-containing protein n=1 Tax=Crotalaria pallida TaxID=3830 RepID=A0AAN9EM77_CROPI
MHSKKKNKNKNKYKSKRVDEEAHGSCSQEGNKDAAGCAACNSFGQDCPQDCPFAPYFPAHDPQRFAVVHKIFGARNFEDIIKEVPEIKRAEAAESMVTDANERERNGIYGMRDPSLIASVMPQYERHHKYQLDTIQAEVNAAKTELPMFLPISSDDAIDAAMPSCDDISTYF